MVNYYTYKITFKDLPKYFYYGFHKDNGKPYLGSPKTWRHLWDLFEPEIQILQWFGTREEACEVEREIIQATWKSKYSLNENCGGSFSEESVTRGGQIGGKKNTPLQQKIRKESGRILNSHANTIKAYKDVSPAKLKARKKNGKENIKHLLAHSNTLEAWKENAKKRRKGIKVTHIKSRTETVFTSLQEACVTLNLNCGNLSQVAHGKMRQHKGYTAEYI